MELPAFEGETIRDGWGRVAWVALATEYGLAWVYVPARSSERP